MGSPPKRPSVSCGAMNIRYYPRPFRPKLMLLLSVLLVGSSCKKLSEAISPGLPEATQEGKNTFGCRVNNKVWLPHTEHVVDSPVETRYSGAGGPSLEIEATRKSVGVNYSRVTLHLDGFTAMQPGTYALNQGTRVIYQDHEAGANDEYRAEGSMGQGSITFTKVENGTNTGIGGITTNYTILSGTFSFTAVSPTSGKTVTLSDGRFDVKGH